MAVGIIFRRAVFNFTSSVDDYDERYAELEAPNGKVKGDLFQKVCPMREGIRLNDSDSPISMISLPRMQL